MGVVYACGGYGVPSGCVFRVGRKLEPKVAQYKESLSHVEEKRLLKDALVGTYIPEQKSQEYINRASKRRKRDKDDLHFDEYSKVQSTRPHERKVEPNYGKGMEMLKMMGWSGGQGLGQQGDGISQPIQLAPKLNKLGIGAVEKKNKK